VALTHARAKQYYDHFGSKQDSQGFYEDRALDDLVAHAVIPPKNSSAQK